MQVQKTIPLNYQFHLPSIIDFVDYGGKKIVIAREEGNWIVLDNSYQLMFFESLRSKTIEESLKELSVQ